jgi:hypothetical protein
MKNDTKKAICIFCETKSTDDNNLLFIHSQKGDTSRAICSECVTVCVEVMGVYIQDSITLRNIEKKKKGQKCSPNKKS